MIRNYNQLADSPAHSVALDCIEAGIRATLPARIVTESVEVTDGVLHIADRTFNLSDYDDVLIVGAGNAASQVAGALEDQLGSTLTGGVVVTDDLAKTTTVEVRAGAHPLPDESSVTSGRRILDQVRSAEARTLILAVVTGGASATLEVPAEGISLADLREMTTDLLESGADIHEINAVRRHVSAVKGGGLATAAAPATIVGLLFSDVVGNNPSVIGSGPTVPDESSYEDALAVVARHGIDLPPSVRDHLEAGRDGHWVETPGREADTFDHVSNVILVEGYDALEAARDVARDQGYRPLILSSRLQGEARGSGAMHTAIASEVRATSNPISPPAVLISGGETTVTLRENGNGGPNQEFVLAAALGLDEPETVVAAIDTDGIDGASHAAGAIARQATASPPDAAQQALDTNDVTPFLGDRNALVLTGPTGTNVSDLRVVVVD